MQLSSRVRELLRGVKETHAKMQARVIKEEKDLAKGKRNLPYTQVFSAQFSINIMCLYLALSLCLHPSVSLCLPLSLFPLPRLLCV